MKSSQRECNRETKEREREDGLHAAVHGSVEGWGPKVGETL